MDSVFEVGDDTHVRKWCSYFIAKIRDCSEMDKKELDKLISDLTRVLCRCSDDFAKWNMNEIVGELCQWINKKSSDRCRTCAIRVFGKFLIDNKEEWELVEKLTGEYFGEVLIWLKENSYETWSYIDKQ